MRASACIGAAWLLLGVPLAAAQQIGAWAGYHFTAVYHGKGGKPALTDLHRGLTSDLVCRDHLIAITDPTARAPANHPLYFSCVSDRTNIPSWSAHLLRHENVAFGPRVTDRWLAYPGILKNPRFQPRGNGEPIQPNGRRTYDRGHLAPRGDFALQKALADATFLVSNRAPQARLFNEHRWRCVEVLVRQLARVEEKDLFVVTGTSGAMGHTTEAGSRERLEIPKEFWKFVYGPDEKDGIVFSGRNDDDEGDIPIPVPSAAAGVGALAEFGLDRWPAKKDTLWKALVEANRLERSALQDSMSRACFRAGAEICPAVPQQWEASILLTRATSEGKRIYGLVVVPIGDLRCPDACAVAVTSVTHSTIDSAIEEFVDGRLGGCTRRLFRNSPSYRDCKQSLSSKLVRKEEWDAGKVASAQFLCGLRPP